MEYTTVELLPEFKHRYKIKADIYNTRLNFFEKVVMFLDTGCFNTMIPKYLAVECGQPLNFKIKCSIGGTVIDTDVFSIDKIVIKNIALERVIALATDFKGELADNILLGANVMNNWKMTFHKKLNTFKFREDPQDNLPNKK
jgi:hypothetical protein